MLAALAPDHVDAEAVLAEDDAGEQMRYGALEELKSTWSALVPGRRLVALFCSNTTATLRAYIGLHAAGHVIVLLSAKMAAQSRTALIKRYSVEAVVEEGAVSLLQEPAGGLHHDLAICLPTSGSTGSPKLAQFSARQLAANGLSIAQYLALDHTERPLTHLPIEYSFGLSVLHSHMAVGAKVLLTNHSIMQKPFWSRLADATSISGVPFHFEMLLRMRLGRADLPHMRMLTQAGGKLAAKDAQTLHDLARAKGWAFHIMYGQTEAGPRISWLPFDEMEQNFDCIGRPIPGVEMDLADDGELVVRSASIMLGYADHRADLALGDRMHGVLRTGDLAERKGPFYRITGRQSRFIKLQGNRVGLAEVEARLSGQGFVVYCVGRDDQLFILTQDADTGAVREAATSLFSFPARSMDVRYISDIPRRDNGKVDYAALLALAEEQEC